ncbi:hypothetical protein QNI19_07445 [Cytophagaceae bacterium DM2B3-1]|uniref:Uncharacterized protein n=1 Tax=Xanthocytophaga flava TaxID=3048013 RepID=A0ABT7CG97_9BACT|nr:hypothetical protein [Xanthocytophaga flavus]MDJ1473604.1 hypothetical protein [Xanthocytophaga flavus]MDJ1492761.1 hypothetical protein [Xanthocytophaga flavus]
MKELRQVIADYENDRVSYDFAKTAIYKITGKWVDKYELNHYWHSESLDSFIERLLLEPIADWAQIDDDRAISLLDELFRNLENNAIVDRNMEALEKRYGKPSGTIVDLVFHENLQSYEILEMLKKDTRIVL